MGRFLVLGATGKTGRLAVRELTRRGHGITAVVRNKKTLADLGLNKVKQLEGTILDSFTDEQVQDMVSDADAVLICLGHVLSFSGIFFPPRRLVLDTLKKVASAMDGGKKKKRIVLMNSNGVRNKSTGEVYPLAERILTGLLYFTLPPHADNVEAAEYLINEVGEHPNVEWCCVRPGDLLDGHENEDYEVVGSVDPSKGVVLGPWKTSRFQVAHFMASLGEGGKVWEDWKFRTPVIYSPALGA